LPLLANYGFFQYPLSSSMIIGAVLIIRSAPGVRLSWLILMKKGIGRVKQPCLKMLTSSIEGMDSEVVRRIFDGFFTTRADGTGVGLAFCRRTIRSFDGDISCLAEPGEFAEFTIDLPAT